jgi:diguanylate cyclase (GGDEF)-like protein/PAS domain S-box-containing protein
MTSEPKSWPSAPSSRRISLLLVEEEDSKAAHLYAILQNAAPAAYDMARARTLSAAVEYLESTPVECVMVSVEFGHVRDIEVVETVAARSPTTALLVLTSNEGGALCAVAIESGATDCVSTQLLDGKLFARSIRDSILRKRLQNSLTEIQSIAGIGSWERDMKTNNFICSRELNELFGFNGDEKATFELLIDRIHPADRDSTLETIKVMARSASPFFIEHRVQLSGGSERWIRTRGRFEFDPIGRPERLLGIAQDITEQRTYEDNLFHHAFHDRLTGLPNRPLFLDRLSQALHRLLRGPSSVTVIYLDIDRFKRINDSLGQAVGDQLLLAVASRLTGVARREDTVARIGADEFLILCEGLSGEAEALGLADRICQQMTEPLAWDDGEFVLSVTAGVAQTTSASVSSESLLRDADAAMHRAKVERRGRSAIFVPTMRTSAVESLDIEIALRQSIMNGGLRLHYQPIVTLIDGQLLGYEALVRWAHPTRGLVPPDEFIHIAEDTGLIVPLGAWVIREACQQAKRFQSRDPRWADLTMSVNLSGGQLGQPDLIEMVSSALRDAELDPDYLQLEMTESVLMDDAGTAIITLESLKDLDVRLGIDDFGTGYSSLAYLRQFPMDVLKIDRSFVDGVGQDVEATAIVAAIVSLADTLGLTTIAEGVETRLQQNSLLSLGCSRAQGYLFSRPVPAKEAEAVLDHIAGCERRGLDPDELPMLEVNPEDSEHSTVG